MKHLIPIFGMVLLILAFPACKKDKAPVAVLSDCADTISFSNQILPILNNNCNTSGCHGNGSAAGGYDLTNHAGVSTNAQIILSAIRHETASPMPLGANQLADSLIQQFSCWKQQGLLDN